jgi:hypothetical protein
MFGVARWGPFGAFGTRSSKIQNISQGAWVASKYLAGVRSVNYLKLPVRDIFFVEVDFFMSSQVLGRAGARQL